MFLRQELLLPKLSQKSHVNWYLEQFYWKIHVNVCTFQSNKSILKETYTTSTIFEIKAIDRHSLFRRRLWKTEIKFELGVIYYSRLRVK